MYAIVFNIIGKLIALNMVNNKLGNFHKKKYAHIFA